MTPFDPTIHHRRSIRLKGYDYTQTGAYFVTLCAWRRECLFGEVVDGEVRLSPAGEVVSRTWQSVPHHDARVALGDWVIMPNHLHGIIWIKDIDGEGEAFALVARREEESLRANEDGKGEAFALVARREEESLWANENSKGEAFALLARREEEAQWANASPQQTRPNGTQPGSLGAILQNFKSVSTRKINQQRGSPGVPVWQRNYYEHIIRNEAEMQRIASYIQQNPLRWQDDQLYPAVPANPFNQEKQYG